jgi:hypothetical protein
VPRYLVFVVVFGVQIDEAAAEHLETTGLLKRGWQVSARSVEEAVLRFNLEGDAEDRATAQRAADSDVATWLGGQHFAWKRYRVEVSINEVKRLGGAGSTNPCPTPAGTSPPPAAAARLGAECPMPPT